MIDPKVHQTLHQFANLSNTMYGSYSHAAGFYESILGMVLSGTMTPQGAIHHIENWIKDNQQVS